MGRKQGRTEVGRPAINTSHLFIEFVIKGVVRERKHLKSEPLLDTGERKIKLNQYGERGGSKREPCPPFNIKSRNEGESKG